MSRFPHVGKRGIALVFAVLVLLGAVPGVAAAETRSGGSVTVGADETVSEDLTVVGGNVVISGTVEGDLEAIGGSVTIDPGAEVTGDIDATAGNVRIDGTVGGNVTTSAGNVFVGQSATIGGTLEAGAGSTVVAGTVEGDARLGGGSITLASTASIGGDVEYSVGEDGEFTNDGADVAGSVTENPDLDIGGGGFGFDVPDLSGPVFGVYGFLVNLLVGGLLLLVLPKSSDRIADAVSDTPLRTGAIGLAALIGVPILLVLVAITIVGIPITLAGFLAYGLAVWLATIYGRYAVGEWLLAYADIDNRWAGLLAGLVVVALLVRVPFVGWLFQLLVLLFGLGAMATLIYRFVRGQRGGETASSAEDSVPA
jgi:cytoskeletal protein CcmA (bactofilin family)